MDQVSAIIITIGMLCQNDMNALARPKYQKECAAKITKCYAEKIKEAKANYVGMLAECLEEPK